MASNLTENLIKFGWITYQEMLDYIQDGILSPYNVIYCSDTNEQYIINGELKPISIKSRVRLYGSVDSAIADIQESKQTYAGELLSIRDGDKFVAYIVNQFSSGEFYLSPVQSDTVLDYDKLSNVPIKNLNGKVGEPIILSNLTDGHYKVTGRFITPKGTEINSIIGNYIIIEDNFVEKHIKRISQDTIFDYVVGIDGSYSCQKYITDVYISEQGFATEEYVDKSIAALEIVTRQELEKYVEETCTMLIQKIVNEELDHRYSDDSDIEKLFS